MLFFVQQGYRVVAHDRRGHGRSAQVSDGFAVPSDIACGFATAGGVTDVDGVAKVEVLRHCRVGNLGRSAQVSDGHDMDHYAADAAAVTEHLDLRKWSDRCGWRCEGRGAPSLPRHRPRSGPCRGRRKLGLAKAVLVSAVPPLMLKTDANPEGLPIAIFDGLRKDPIMPCRHQFRTVPSEIVAPGRLNP
jgi:pimeloyl-ACP methyl ester carboxylesterase